MLFTSTTPQQKIHRHLLEPKQCQSGEQTCLNCRPKLHSPYMLHIYGLQYTLGQCSSRAMPQAWQCARSPNRGQKSLQSDSFHSDRKRKPYIQDRLWQQQWMRAESWSDFKPYLPAKTSQRGKRESTLQFHATASWQTTGGIPRGSAQVQRNYRLDH